MRLCFTHARLGVNRREKKPAKISERESINTRIDSLLLFVCWFILARAFLFCFLADAVSAALWRGCYLWWLITSRVNTRHRPSCHHSFVISVPLVPHVRMPYRIDLIRLKFQTSRPWLYQTGSNDLAGYFVFTRSGSRVRMLMSLSKYRSLVSLLHFVRLLERGQSSPANDSIQFSIGTGTTVRIDWNWTNFDSGWFETQFLFGWRLKPIENWLETDRNWRKTHQNWGYWFKFDGKWTLTEGKLDEIERKWAKLTKKNGKMDGKWNLTEWEPIENEQNWQNWLEIDGKLTLTEGKLTEIVQKWAKLTKNWREIDPNWRETRRNWQNWLQNWQNRRKIDHHWRKPRRNWTKIGKID